MPHDDTTPVKKVIHKFDKLFTQQLRSRSLTSCLNNSSDFIVYLTWHTTWWYYSCAGGDPEVWQAVWTTAQIQKFDKLFGQQLRLHCLSYLFISPNMPHGDTTPVQEVIQKFDKLKSVCQELQRDVTMRRCLARKDEIQRLQERIEGLQQQLLSHFTILDAKQQALEKVGVMETWGVCVCVWKYVEGCLFLSLFAILDPWVLFGSV